MLQNLLGRRALVASFFCSLIAATPVTSATQSFDYVVIGSGPAGLVLAEYLTRNPNVTVLVLETGKNQDTSDNVTVPGHSTNILNNVNLYYSQPDPVLGGNAPELGQARVVGGGSTVNDMGYCRGAASVFDQWAEISGNQGLAWPSMLEAFKATTHYSDDRPRNFKQAVNKTNFGNGPLAVSRESELLNLDQPFINLIAKEYNIPEIDFMSGDGVGVSPGLASIRDNNRTRSYAYNSFGYLAVGRPNFQLRSQAIATKIGFTGTTANSVTYNDTTTNTIHTVKAKEVVAANGAINVPQLLMVSGVGPANVLKAAGIPVVINAPGVGQNLSDHHFAVVGYEAVPKQQDLWKLDNNATWAAHQQALYNKNGSGILGTNLADAFGAVRVPDSVFNGTGNFYPDLPTDRPHGVFEYFASAVSPPDPAINQSLISAWSAIVQPESRGNVSVASPSIYENPIINSNFYAAPSEQALILYIYKKLRSILSNPAIIPNYLVREVYPGPNVTSDADIWHAIQNASRSWHHPVGTASIGYVLDANWRVKGAQGLRVIGSAAIPQIPTCPIQASVYAIAYRAAIDIAQADGVHVLKKYCIVKRLVVHSTRRQFTSKNF